MSGGGEPATAVPEDEIGRLLQVLQRIFVKHPIASQAAFRALIAEGRLFARTVEGQAWRNRLAASSLIQRGRVVWDETTLRMFEDDSATVLPSALVDAFVHAALVDGIEPLLSRIFEEGMFGGVDVGPAER